MTCISAPLTMGNVPFGRGGTTDGDAGWKQQNKQQDTNVVYKFMNLQKGGTLIDAYNREQNGLEAVRTIIRDELDSFMYGHGKGKVIRKIDFIKWKRRCKTDLKVSGHKGMFLYSVVVTILDFSWKLSAILQLLQYISTIIFNQILIFLNNGKNGSCLTWLATLLEEKRRWLIINASPRSLVN